MSRKPLSCFLALLMLMTVMNCRQQRELQPLGNYYGYQLADSIALRLLHNRPANVLLGIDKDSLQLAATAVDHQGKPIPDALFTYLVDGVPLPSNTFLPAKEGQYIIEARLGKAVSKPIPIQAIDPRNYIKSLKLSVTLSHGEFIADNYTQTLLKTELLDAQGKPFPFNLSQAVTYLVNGQEIRDSTFRTDKPGTYAFKAVLFDKVSNEVSVKALTLSEAGIITIPIIFHLLDTDIPQENLQHQIEVLNQTFRDKWNPENGPKAERHADLRLHFKLAEFDPNGSLLKEPGRDFIKKGRVDYTVEELQASLGWPHYWNPDYYVNAFVGNFTSEFSAVGRNWAGAAYHPVTSQPLVGMRTALKGTTPDYLYCMYLKPQVFDFQSTVISHEIGHMLALAHTFNQSGCTIDPDWCEDTPAYDQQLYLLKAGEYGYKRISCTDTEFVSTNIMDYAPSYSNSFTIDQAARARHVINYGLWLPTPFNGRTNPGGRRSAAPGYVKRPAVVTNVQPHACPMPLPDVKSFGWNRLTSLR